MKTATATTTKATLTSVDQSKLCSVTNNSGTDIVVGSPLTTAETENSNPIVSYNKDFVILTTASGGTVIKDGGSDKVTLDRTHIDIKTNQPTYSKGYDLLISTSNWLTPIANIGIYLNPIMKVFKPQTVTADNKTAMQQTADFYQTIAAYPTSQLAKNYIDAMNDTNNSADGQADGSANSATNVDNTIENGVVNFFKNTKSYQKVTLSSIVALESYYNRFPFAWANYTDSVTYYLYSSDGTTTSFQGALSLSKSGSIDITKPNGGYTCSFIPAVTPTDTSKTDVDNSKAKALSFSDGVFVDDLNSDNPQIALKGTFQLKRTFTKDPNDTKIIVVISGTVNGATCVGFDSAQATKPDDSTQDWLNSLFHPQTAAQIFNSVMQILGALMMLHFVVTTLYGIGKWVKEKVSGSEPVNSSDLKAQRDSVTSEAKANIDTNYKKVAGKDATTPETSQDALNTAAEKQSALSDQVSKGQIETSVDKMSDNIEDLETYASQDTTNPNYDKINQDIESAGDDLGTAWDNFNTSGETDLKSAVQEMQQQIKDLKGQISDLNTKVQDAVSTDQKAEYDQNVDNMTEVESDVTNQEKTTEDEANDEADTDPEAEGMDFPE